MISLIHTLFGALTLVLGAWNLFAKKGTRLHRGVGWFYAGAMYGLLFTSFFIFNLYDGFGVFHIASILSGITLTVALYFPLRRRKYRNWVEHHYFWIGYSYVGLVMATGSHLFEVFPTWPWEVRAVVFWGVPYLVGNALIFSQRKRLLPKARATANISV